MPMVTVWESFTDGHMSWKEPKQVWRDPTPEEAAADAEREAKLEATRADLLERTDNLIADMKRVLGDKPQDTAKDDNA